MGLIEPNKKHQPKGIEILGSINSKRKQKVKKVVKLGFGLN